MVAVECDWRRRHHLMLNVEGSFSHAQVVSQDLYHGGERWASMLNLFGSCEIR